MRKRLVLFDIDETMISSDGAGSRAIGRSLHQLLGVPKEAAKITMSGKTDPQILKEILGRAGHDDSAIQERLDELIELYLSVLAEEIQGAGYYIIHEGVVELLDELAARSDIFLALLTGNVERGARMKLARFDLNKYFPVGSFGSDSHDRLDLPAIAVKRANHHFQQSFLPSEVVVIGDSVNDVLCAKGYGAKCIAVNTGKTPWSDLEAQSPEYLMKSLKNTAAVIDAIMN